jgi:hypothetical protein
MRTLPVVELPDRVAEDLEHGLIILFRASSYFLVGRLGGMEVNKACLTHPLGQTPGTVDSASATRSLRSV